MVRRIAAMVWILLPLLARNTHAAAWYVDQGNIGTAGGYAL